MSDLRPVLPFDGGLELKLQSREIDGIVIIDLYGKLMGGPDADIVRDALHGIIDGGNRRVVINLRGVNWINSTGVGILMTGYTTMRRSGGDLKLLNVSDRLQSILYVTKLNLIFECFDSEDEAVASFEND
ncbi:MAG: STAS domain-containing protein [Candidatus Krumholzibacteria bacterium]|nr:STAS domain-containing protein [Candidatus Krumholzibacteria bacterium]